LLVERKYFANCEEGSEEYTKRANTARERFFAKFQKPVDAIAAMTKEQRAEEAEKHKNKANDLLKERKWQEAVDEYSTALKYAESAVIFANRAVPYGMGACLVVWFVWFVCLFGLVGLFVCLFVCLFHPFDSHVQAS
jgi:hypothetical protein